MSENHFTGIERRRDHFDGLQLRALCPEHGTIGNIQEASQHGFNAVVTEARAHDAMVHGVYRTDMQYRNVIYTLNHPKKGTT